MLKLAAAISAIALVAAPAVATVTITSTSYGFNVPAGAGTVVNFDDPIPTDFSLGGTGYVIHEGTAANNNGQGAAPAISASDVDATKYLSVYGGAATLTGTTAATYNTLSLFWGSIDTYNSIDLLSSTGTILATITGTQAAATANGDQGSGATNRRVNILSTDAFSSVRFNSTQAAFELDNVKFSNSSVPEPASWMMMILGFGAVGYAMRRRATLAAQGAAS